MTELESTRLTLTKLPTTRLRFGSGDVGHHHCVRKPAVSLAALAGSPLTKSHHTTTAVRFGPSLPTSITLFTMAKSRMKWTDTSRLSSCATIENPTLLTACPIALPSMKTAIGTVTFERKGAFQMKIINLWCDQSMHLDIICTPRRKKDKSKIEICSILPGRQTAQWWKAFCSMLRTGHLANASNYRTNIWIIKLDGSYYLFVSSALEAILHSKLNKRSNNSFL